MAVKGSVPAPGLIVLDDWGLAPFRDQERRDMLEILEDRHGARSTIVVFEPRTEAGHYQTMPIGLGTIACDGRSSALTCWKQKPACKVRPSKTSRTV